MRLALALVLTFAGLAVWPLAARADAGTSAQLARVRSDPALASDPRAIDELVRRADASPPDAERLEAWALAAEAYAERLDRPADAERLDRQIVAEAGADPVLVAKARRDLVTLLLARGDRAGALAAGGGDAALSAEVARAIRRHRLHLASIGWLSLLVVFTLSAVASAVRRGTAGAVARALRKIAPVAVVYAAYVAIAGGSLASRFDGASATPFVVLGGALLAVLLLSRAWGAAGAATRAARIARAALSACGALGAAFLVLEGVDAAYLDGLGL